MSQPMVELMSIAAGDGKTQLLYHLSARAVLPYRLGGQQAAVVIIDADGRFSVDALATQIQRLLADSRGSIAGSETTLVIESETISALKHVHIFRPQSLGAVIATLDSLPDYLFSQTRHHSFDRDVAFIAVDSASAFYWQDQAQTENAKFQVATEEIISEKPDTTSDYQPMFASLKEVTQALSCPAIVTTWHLQPVYAENRTSRSYRQVIHDFRPTIRLVVIRLPVRKFPPGLTVEQALRESVDRQKAVDQSKFECFVNQSGMDGRAVKAFDGDRSGFIFVNAKKVVAVDKDGKDEPAQTEP